MTKINKAPSDEKIQGFNSINDYLKACFYDSPSETYADECSFDAQCHDCDKRALITITRDEDGQLKESGGHLYLVKPEYAPKRVVAKCAECFASDTVIRRFQPCEVYSRVVGYLRPVRQWNPGKIAEFKMRVPYDLSREIESIKPEGI